MDWSRGLFRLWVVCSFAWLLGAGSLVAYEWSTAPPPNAGCQGQRAGPWCDYQPKAGETLTEAQVFGPPQPKRLPWLGIALCISPPLAALIIGRAMLWVGLGFRRAGANQ
jgi:hypothetical protein